MKVERIMYNSESACDEVKKVLHASSPSLDLLMLSRSLQMISNAVQIPQTPQSTPSVPHVGQFAGLANVGLANRLHFGRAEPLNSRTTNGNSRSQTGERCAYPALPPVQS